MLPHVRARRTRRVWQACALWGLVSACAGPVTAPVIETVDREFSLQGGFITGTLRIPSLPAGPRPVVLQPVVDAEELLARGIAVVRYQMNWQMLAGLEPERPAEQAQQPSPAEPAESVGRWLLAAPRPGIVGREYFGLIAAEARRIVPLVMDRLEDEPGIDPSRVAIAGSSTRGFVALEALVEEPRLAAGVVRVACGDYHAFLRSSSLALDDDERWLVDGELSLDEAYETRLRGQEPIRSADRFPPRPLLMLNGARDDAVPPACARATARELERAYREAGAPERFRFVLYEDRGHDLGPGAAAEILAWWERWLHPQP